MLKGKVVLANTVQSILKNSIMHISRQTITQKNSKSSSEKHLMGQQILT